MTTFVFSRRKIQEVLDDLTHVLSQDQIQDLVDRLNRRGKDRLAAMWEAVLLRALSSIGMLRHEVTLANGRKPDIELAVGSGPEILLVVGDITTVSDAGLDAKNPFDKFWNELTRLAKRHGLDPNHFHITVRGGMVGTFRRNAEIQLKLPKRRELVNFMKDIVEPFVRQLREKPRPSAQFRHETENESFQIEYDQSRRAASGGHISYTVAPSLSKNPIAYAFNRKSDQLKAAPANAIRLLVICDGDCDLLRSRTAPVASFGRKQIVQDALRRKQGIDATLLVNVDHYGVGVGSRFELRWELVAVSAFTQGRLDNEKYAMLNDAMERAMRTLPRVVRAPENAAWRCAEWDIDAPIIVGGHQCGGNVVKLSSKALTRLLAGKTPMPDFLVAQAWEQRPDGSSTNPFARMVAEGRMIKSVTVESGGETDDDWVRFEYGNPEPAAAPFAIKKLK